MARRPTEFPKNWVQMSDFKWTKTMSKQDRWFCKLYIDWILADVEKRDRAIMDMWEQLTKAKIDVNRKLGELRDRKDYEIWLLKKKLETNEALYKKEKSKNTSLALVAIIAWLIMIIESILFFF